jgi:hypothetical protein
MNIRCDIRGTSHTDGASVNERRAVTLAAAVIVL